MAQKIVAFVAKSFDPRDEAKIAPIERFLESFHKLGFVAEPADKGEVESVSEKVRSQIDRADVLVGIFTRRHPVYSFNGRLRTALSVLSGKLTPTEWSAPSWVLQESGYALKSKGKNALILFREIGVELPGLQGDLEYIAFDPQNPVLAFQRASEMITDLIAKAGGIKVETVVQAEPVRTTENEPNKAQPPKPSEKEASNEAPGEDLPYKEKILELWKAASDRNWEEAERLYQEGLKWIKAHKPEEEVFWKCFYWRRLFAEGNANALSQLRSLVHEYKTDPSPLDYLGDCLKELHEYDEAVKCYLAAASLAPPSGRAWMEISAAEALKDAKRPSESKSILLNLRHADYAEEPEIQFRVLRSLYTLEKVSDDKFASFAIAELALHQRPEETTFRFSLAHDYGDVEQDHMSLYHYRIICDQDEKNAGALNNLGVALANSDLAVLAAKRYKESYKLGETLAASNLARKYLEAGLSDEAVGLLKEAQTKENCVPEVAATLAAVHEKSQQNIQQEEKVIAQAEQHRDFLLNFAPGYFSPAATNLPGRWSLPSCEIQLQLNGIELSGSREDRTTTTAPLSYLSYGLAGLHGSTPKSITRTEKFQFSGNLSGRTCKFRLEITRSEEPLGFRSLLGGSGDSKAEGYIIFAEDGNSADVVELKAGKPEKYYKISKATSV
jgi:Flp pilus assembly protein TadD